MVERNDKRIYMPYTPEARFALFQMGREVGPYQVHPLPREEDMPDAEDALVNANGNITDVAADLLADGVIDDARFVTIFEEQRRNILGDTYSLGAVPGEFVDIYRRHMGAIVEEMERRGR